MNTLINLVITAALIDNIVLTKMLGLCPFINLSQRLGVAFSVGAATTFVLTIACALAWIIDSILPTSLISLRALLFIAIVSSLVQIIEKVAYLKFPGIHRHLGIFLPLIATNCAVLGIILLALQSEKSSFIEVTAQGLGGGLGFCLAVICLTLIRDRLQETVIPKVLRGAPIMMITTGVMALAFSGLHGAF